MRKYIFWFLISIKRQIFKKSLYISIILLPVISFLYLKYISYENLSVNIALYTEDEELGKALENKLTFKDKVYTFYKVDSLEELKKDIVYGHTEAGFHIKKELKEKFDKKDYKNAVTVFLSGKSPLGKVSKEVVFAEFIKIYGKNILLNYAKDEEVFKSGDFNENLEKLRRYYDENLSNGQTFRFEYENINKALKNKDTKTNFPLRGIIGIYIFLESMLAVYNIYQDEERGVYLIFGRKKVIAGITYSLSQLFLPALISLITVFMLKENESVIREILCIFFYSLFTVLFSLLIKSLFKNKNTLLVFSGVTVSISMLVSPVFFDISSVSPIYKYLSLLLPPTHYINMFYNYNSYILMLSFIIISICLLKIINKENGGIKYV